MSNNNAGNTNSLHIIIRAAEITLYIFFILISGYRYMMADKMVAATAYIVIAVISSCWFSYLLLEKKKIHVPPRPSVYLLLVLSVITSFVHSIDPGASFNELSLWFIAAFIFLVIYNLVIYGYPKNYLVDSALVTGAVYVILKLFQAVSLYINRTNTCSKLTNLQNKTAGMAGLILILALAIAIERKGKARIFPGALAVGSSIVLFITGSRGGLIATAAALFVFIAITEIQGRTKIMQDWRKAAPVLLTVVAIPVISVLALRPVECVSLVTGAVTDNPAWSTNITTRVDAWRLALAIAEEFPALGSGPGTYQVIAVPIFEGTHHAAHAHNIYLHILAERGIIGLMAALAVTLVAITYIAVMQPDPVLVSAGVSVLVLYCVHGLVDAVTLEPLIARYAAIILALAMTAGKDVSHAEVYK